MRTNELTHHGILGMHWGIRKAEEGLGRQYRKDAVPYQKRAAKQRNIANRVSSTHIPGSNLVSKAYRKSASTNQSIADKKLHYANKLMAAAHKAGKTPFKNVQNKKFPAKYKKAILETLAFTAATVAVSTLVRALVDPKARELAETLYNGHVVGDIFKLSPKAAELVTLNVGNSFLSEATRSGTVNIGLARKYSKAALGFIPPKF